jgi:hypothetical protein
MPVCDHTHRLHAVMAGVGDPYRVLRPAQLLLVRRLLDDIPLRELAAGFGYSEQALRQTMQPLIAANLVVAVDESYRPSFFVALEDEVGRVDTDARNVGRLFAAHLRTRWPELEDAWTPLTVSASLPFATAAFMSVGDHILDVGLLDALARDGAVLTPAPSRPAPTTPDARYYFWMIEGEHDQLGCYGQRATPLPWPGWVLLTYGRYLINNVPNHARDALERSAQQLLRSGVESPAALARQLGVALVDATDARAWHAVARLHATELAAIYSAREPALRALHAATRVGRARPETFAEFICWHDHLAYAHAIDQLATDGLLSLPDTGFAAAVWHAGDDAAAF